MGRVSLVKGIRISTDERSPPPNNSNEPFPGCRGARRTATINILRSVMVQVDVRGERTARQEQRHAIQELGNEQECTRGKRMSRQATRDDFLLTPRLDRIGAPRAFTGNCGVLCQSNLTRTYPA